MKYRPAPKPFLPTIHDALAIDRMKEGSILVHAHGKGIEKRWFVIPGGPITDDTAESIRSRPDVTPQNDGLFPGQDQTWRMEVSK